ncbi:MAG TPA: DNA replication and repair protein RecF [Pyrinomonadaceae bacterium]|jgi:DNA replication and repair protein RecF|nr:DNA replication and repair protein RecF [Pyrinomonadaceae bacterium]
MLLERLSATDFRNLSGEVHLAPGLNVLAGENGQGKTNWLESIAVLASTRSFRATRLQETIRFGRDQGAVTGLVRESPEIIRELSVVISGVTRSAFVNGKKEPIQRYLGQLHAVVFNSEELEVVRGQPDARRRFLDAGIVALHPPFVQVFVDYNRVIKQKNALLQSAREAEQPLEKVAERLEPWNQQLAKLAAKIHRGRVRFVERLNEVLEKRLFGREELSIRYSSSLESKGDLSVYEELITERLKLRVQAEIVAGHALIGPHRDDMDVSFDGHDLRKFGSAGQQRSALLLLQLAGIAVFHATRGEYPLFLIDDIDAELDYKRIGKLLDFLSDKTQTVVTTSKESFIDRFSSGAHILRVENGAAKTA